MPETRAQMLKRFAKRRQKVMSLLDQGLPKTQISKRLKISRARIRQIELRERPDAV